jgi:Aerotolerance regulator N-terminal/von Willebrand factor type A domain
VTFLAPLFLFGALAIAGPVIFHLIRRTTREKTPFSSLMFLKPTPPRITRRSRIENLWLLLLRCAAIALLALGFSRPFFQQHVALPPANTASKRTVLLVDTSASMRRDDLASAARARAEAWLQKAAPVDEVSVLAFSRASSLLVSFEQWRGARPDERVPLALAQLDAAKPGWAGTSLGAAMLRASELLEAGADVPATREVVIISDMQDGAKLDGLQGFAWPKGIRVTLDTVRVGAGVNASAHWLAEGEDPSVRLRVQNGAGGTVEQFRLQWQPASPADGLDVYVPAGQARTARLPGAPAQADRIVLSGDAVNFDNTLYVLPLAPVRVPVLFVGTDKPDDPQGALYYLLRAFPPTREQIVEVLARSTRPVEFDLQRAQMLILGDGLTEPMLDAAREFARGGKIVLLPLARAESAPALARLTGADVPLIEAKARNYSLLTQIDFAHPVFAPFADPRYSDFTKIHFWKHRVADFAKLPSAKVLASFDDRSPALVQVPAGGGSVVVLGTTWRPADSQLALSSKFVPLLHALLEQSSRLPRRRAQYFVGDPVPFPPAPQAFRVKSPSGSETEVASGGTFTATDEPGVYTATPGPARFVVNLPPEESRLDPLDPARLVALGVPLEKEASTSSAARTGDPALTQATELESRQKIWRWLIVAALVVLLIETLVAGRLSRAERAQPA